MTADREGSEDGFLRRWARVKSEARESAATPAARPAPPQADPREPAPELPPLDQLTLESDFRGFFHPKVDEDLRRGALRKLFSDPHFNVMDGLDVYIDDYSKSEPIPAAMLAGLKQAQRILEWAAEKPIEKQSSAEGLATTEGVPQLPGTANLEPEETSLIPTPLPEGEGFVNSPSGLVRRTNPLPEGAGFVNSPSGLVRRTNPLPEGEEIAPFSPWEKGGG